MIDEMKNEKRKTKNGTSRLLLIYCHFICILA